MSHPTPWSAPDLTILLVPMCSVALIPRIRKSMHQRPLQAGPGSQMLKPFFWSPVVQGWEGPGSAWPPAGAQAQPQVPVTWAVLSEWCPSQVCIRNEAGPQVHPINPALSGGRVAPVLFDCASQALFSLGPERGCQASLHCYLLQGRWAWPAGGVLVAFLL